MQCLPRCGNPLTLGLAAGVLTLLAATAAPADTTVYQQTLRSTAWVVSPITDAEKPPAAAPGPTEGKTPQPPSPADPPREEKPTPAAQADNEVQVSFGTGVLVDARRRLLVTNFHVVEKRPDVIVFFPSFQGGDVVTDPEHYKQNLERLAVRGKVLYAEARHDLAVVQL